MVCASVHGADDCCWLVLLVLWVFCNGLTSLEHDLHVRMHLFQAQQDPADGLVVGRLGKARRTEVTRCGVCLYSWS